MTINTSSRPHLLVLAVLATLANGCVTDGEDEELDEELESYNGTEEGKEDSVRVSPPCDPDHELGVNACALLGTIAYAEGTGTRYNITYAYRTFRSYADHPRINVCAGGWCSTAAGRYQILAGTWDRIRTGLADFSPGNQDRAALKLIRNRGVLDVNAIDTYSEFAAAIRKLNREWASLPGSPYGQPTYSLSTLWNQFRRLRGDR